MNSAIISLARKGTAPDPTSVGYPWGLFSAKEKPPIASGLSISEASRSSTTQVVSRGDTLENLLAAIYPLQLTNYLYSSISFIYCQGYSE